MTLLIRTGELPDQILRNFRVRFMHFKSTDRLILRLSTWKMLRRVMMLAWMSLGWLRWLLGTDCYFSLDFYQIDRWLDRKMTVPDWPFHIFRASRSILLFRNAVQRILKLKSCKRIGRVTPCSVESSWYLACYWAKYFTTDHFTIFRSLKSVDRRVLRGSVAESIKFWNF